MSIGGPASGDITPQEAAIIGDLLRQDPSLSSIPLEFLVEAIRYGTPRAMPALRSPAPTASVDATPVTQSQRLLRVIRELNRAVAMSQLPVTLGAQVFIEDKAKRDDLLAIMDILQRMSAAPVVADITTRGIDNVVGADPNKRREAAMMAAGELGQEALIQSIPTLRSLARMLR